MMFPVCTCRWERQKTGRDSSLTLGMTGEEADRGVVLGRIGEYPLWLRHRSARFGVERSPLRASLEQEAGEASRCSGKQRMSGAPIA